MADENDNTQDQASGETVDTSKARGTLIETDASAPETPAESTDAKANKVEDLPEWAQKELKSAREEAAKFRAAKNEALEKLASAKSPEEFEAARKEFATKNAQLERELVAAKYGLPEVFARKLEGSSREELEADAEAMRALLAASQPEPDPAHHNQASGGLNPTEDAEDHMTPQELAKRFGRRPIL